MKKTKKESLSLSVGRESLKRATSVNYDVVFKRMKLMEQRGVVDFVYHNTNACYKNYTHHKSVEAAAKRNACQLSSVSESEKTTEKLKCSNKQCHYAFPVLHVLHQAQKKILESSDVQYVVQMH